MTQLNIESFVDANYVTMDEIKRPVLEPNQGNSQQQYSPGLNQNEVKLMKSIENPINKILASS
ncbi:MAG: hypothetical protein WBP64_20530 [Nitrososphaeraceae archaeon]|jgi:hypothetical protein